MKKGPLDNLLLSYPCPIDWDSMEGDDYKRYCNQCSLNVYNISSLSREEAERFLEEEEGVCIRFYQRPDGSVKTRDCASFLHRTREKNKLIKKSLLVASSFFLSLFSGVFKPVDSATAEDCVKTKWHGSSRDFDLHALDGVVGRPFRSDVRQIIEKLLKRYEYQFSPREQSSTLSKVTRDIEKTHSIKPDHVETLKNYYKEQKDNEMYLSARLLEVTLTVENPIIAQSLKESSVLNFEELRFAEMKDLLLEAQRLVEADEDALAFKSLAQFIHFGSLGQSLIEADFRLPNKLEKWKYPRYGSTKENPRHSWLLATKEQLDQAVKLLSQLKTEDKWHDPEQLRRRLILSQLFKRFQSSQDANLKSKIEALESELGVIEVARRYPSAYLAKLAKCKIEDNGPDSYFFNVFRVFKPVKKIAGEGIESEKFQFSDYSQNFRKDQQNKKEQYNLSRFSSYTKLGSEFVVFCSSPNNASKNISSIKAFPATPSLIKLVKKQFRYIH